jgi:uncharacterized ParB-like nuclease family protein
MTAAQMENPATPVASGASDCDLFGRQVSSEDSGKARIAQEISLNGINADGDTQMRAIAIDPNVVAEYASAMQGGAEFPAVVLFHDGETYWPGDGYHRIAAARQIGRETIAAEVRQGNRRDAVLHAVGANATHGLQRTQADKRRAVTVLLRDPEWAKWSDRAIAKACSVDHKTVAATRRELTGEIPSDKSLTGEIPSDRTYRTKHGTVATMRATVKASEAGSMVERMLASATTDQLVAECRRRGIEVAA